MILVAMLINDQCRSML